MKRAPVHWNDCILWLLPLLAFLGGCATKRRGVGEYYAQPPSLIARSVKTVAVTPPQIWLPLPEADRQRIRSCVEGALVRGLRAKGYQVVEPAQVEEVWRRFSGQLGGVFDPASGKADPEKRKLLEEFLRRELASRFDAQALAWNAIERLPAYGSDGSPATEFLSGKIVWRGGVLQEMPQLTVGVRFVLRLVGTDGAFLFGAARQADWWQVYAQRQYYNRSPSDVLPAHACHAAVEDTLQPLVPAGAVIEPKTPAEAAPPLPPLPSQRSRR